MVKFNWPTPGLMAQLKYCETHKVPELTLEMLEEFLNKLNNGSNSRLYSRNSNNPTNSILLQVKA